VDRPLVAADLLAPAFHDGNVNPFHKGFVAWCEARVAVQPDGCGHIKAGGYNGEQADASALTVRKARKYLRELRLAGGKLAADLAAIRLPLEAPEAPAKAA
jgi:hypothetical protein